MRSAAQTKHRKTIPLKISVHKFVGSKIRELRGDIPQSKFAANNGLHQGELDLYEYGTEIASLNKLKSLAQKNSVKVEFFFPDGKVPERYPEF